MAELAKRLPASAGLSVAQLYRFTDLYRTYPQIFATLSRKLAEVGWNEPKLLGTNASSILQTVSAKSSDLPGLAPDLLVSQYQLNLPTEDELRQLIEAEQSRLSQTT